MPGSYPSRQQGRERSSTTGEKESEVEADRRTKASSAFVKFHRRATSSSAYSIRSLSQQPLGRQTNQAGREDASTRSSQGPLHSESKRRPEHKQHEERPQRASLLGNSKASHRVIPDAAGPITAASATAAGGSRTLRRHRSSSSSLRRRSSRRSFAHFLRGSTIAKKTGSSGASARKAGDKDNSIRPGPVEPRRVDSLPARPPRSDLRLYHNRQDKEKNTAEAAEATTHSGRPSTVYLDRRDYPTTPPRTSSQALHRPQQQQSHSAQPQPQQLPQQRDNKRQLISHIFADNRSPDWPASPSPLYGLWQPDAAEPTSLPPPPRSPSGSVGRRRAEELRRASQISQLDLSSRSRSGSLLGTPINSPTVDGPQQTWSSVGESNNGKGGIQQKPKAISDEARAADFAPLTPSSLRSANRQERIAAAAAAARTQAQVRAQLLHAAQSRQKEASSSSSTASNVRASILQPASSSVSRASQALVGTTKRWSPGSKKSGEFNSEKSPRRKGLPSSELRRSSDEPQPPPSSSSSAPPPSVPAGSGRTSSGKSRIRFSRLDVRRSPPRQSLGQRLSSPFASSKKRRQRASDASTASFAPSQANTELSVGDSASWQDDVFVDAPEESTPPSPPPSPPPRSRRRGSSVSSVVVRSIASVVHRAQRSSSAAVAEHPREELRRHSIDHSPQSSSSSASRLSARRRNVISDPGPPPPLGIVVQPRPVTYPAASPAFSSHKTEGKKGEKETGASATTKRILTFGFGSIARRSRADSASTPSQSGSRRSHKAKSKSLGQDPLSDILSGLDTPHDSAMPAAASASTSTSKIYASPSSPTRVRASAIPVAAPANSRLSGPQSSRAIIVNHTHLANQSVTLSGISSDMATAAAAAAAEPSSSRSGLPLYRSNSKRESTLDFLEADGGPRSVRRAEGKRAESEASASLRAIHQARENASRSQFAPPPSSSARPSTSPKTHSSFSSSVRRMFGGRAKSTSQASRPPVIHEAEAQTDRLGRIEETDARPTGIGGVVGRDAAVDARRTKDQLQQQQQQQQQQLQQSKPSKGSSIFAPFRAKTPPRPKVDLEGVEVQRQHHSASAARQSLPAGAGATSPGATSRADGERRSSVLAQQVKRANENGTSSPPSTPVRRTATASPPRSGLGSLRSPERSLTLQALSTAPASPYSSLRRTSGGGGAAPAYLPRLPPDLARLSTDGTLAAAAAAAERPSTASTDEGTGVALSTSPGREDPSSPSSSNGRKVGPARASVPRMWQGSRNSASLLTTAPENETATDLETDLETETETERDAETDADERDGLTGRGLGAHRDDEERPPRDSPSRRFGSSATTGSMSSFKTAKSSPRAQYLEGSLAEASSTPSQPSKSSRQALSLLPTATPARGAGAGAGASGDRSTLSTPRGQLSADTPTKPGVSPLSDLIHNLEQRKYSDYDSELGDSSTRWPPPLAAAPASPRTGRVSRGSANASGDTSNSFGCPEQQPPRRGLDGSDGLDGDFGRERAGDDDDSSPTSIQRRRYTFGDEEANHASSSLARPPAMGSPSSPQLASVAALSSSRGQPRSSRARVSPRRDDNEVDDVFTTEHDHGAEQSISVSEIESNLAAVEAALRRHNLEGSFDPASLRRRIVTPRGVSISMFDDEGRNEFGVIEDDGELSRVTLPPEQESALQNAVKEVRRAISSSQLPQIPNEDDDTEGGGDLEIVETREPKPEAQLLTPSRPSVLEDGQGVPRQRESTPMRAARNRQESMQDVEEAYARMCDLVGSAAGFAPSPMQEPAASWRRRSTKSQPTQYRAPAEPGEVPLQERGYALPRERTQSAAPAPPSYLFGPSQGGDGGGSASTGFVNPRVAARQALLRESDALSRAAMMNPASSTTSSSSAALVAGLPGLSEEMGEKVQYLRGRTSNLSTGSRRAASESPPRRKPYQDIDSALVVGAATATAVPVAMDASSAAQFGRSRTQTSGSAKSTKRTSATSATGSAVGTGTSPSATAKTQGTPRSSEIESAHPEWQRLRTSPNASRLPLHGLGGGGGGGGGGSGGGSGSGSKRASQASSSIITNSPIIESRAMRNFDGPRRGTRGHVSTSSAQSNQGIGAFLSSASPTPTSNAALRQQQGPAPAGRDSWRDWHRLEDHINRPSSRTSLASNVAVAQALAVAAVANNGSSLSNTPAGGGGSNQGHHHSGTQRAAAHASRHSGQLSSLDGSGGHLSSFFDAGSIASAAGGGAGGGARGTGEAGWGISSPSGNGQHQQSSVNAVYRRHALERDSLLDMLQRSRLDNAELRSRNEQLESDLHQEVTRVLELQRELDLRQEEQAKKEARIGTLESQLEVEHADRVRIAELLEKVQKALDNAASAGARPGLLSSPTASSVSILQEDLQPALSRRMLDIPGGSSVSSHAHVGTSSAPTATNGHLPHHEHEHLDYDDEDDREVLLHHDDDDDDDGGAADDEEDDHEDRRYDSMRSEDFDPIEYRDSSSYEAGGNSLLHPPVEQHHHHHHHHDPAERSPSLHSYPSALGLDVKDDEMRWQLDDEQAPEETGDNTDSEPLPHESEALVPASAPATAPAPASASALATASTHDTGSPLPRPSRMPMSSSTSIPSSIAMSQSTSTGSTVLAGPTSSADRSIEGVRRLPTSPPRSAGLAERFGSGSNPRRMPSTTSTAATSLSASSPRVVSRNVSISSIPQPVSSRRQPQPQQLHQQQQPPHSPSSSSSAAPSSAMSSADAWRKMSSSSRVTSGGGNTSAGDTSYTAQTVSPVGSFISTFPSSSAAGPAGGGGSSRFVSGLPRASRIVSSGSAGNKRAGGAGAVRGGYYDPRRPPDYDPVDVSVLDALSADGDESRDRPGDVSL